MAESDDRSSLPGGLPAAPGASPDSVPPAARERVVDALSRAFAADELSEGQLETLLDDVFRATTLAELDTVVGNLPVPVTAGADAPAGAALRAGVAGHAPAAEPVRVRALLSGQERKLTGVVPRRMELRARLGYVELDLTQATFEPGVTEIDARALMGYVQIRCPANVQVENDGGAIFGFFALKGGSGATAASPRVVRVTGRAVMGFTECFVRTHGRGPA